MEPKKFNLAHPNGLFGGILMPFYLVQASYQTKAWAALVRNPQNRIEKSAPVVEDLARAYDGRAVVAKVNTDENTQTAVQLGIMGIPTLILFKDGQEVDRVVGYAPQRVLEEKLNALLN